MISGSERVVNDDFFFLPHLFYPDGLVCWKFIFFLWCILSVCVCGTISLLCVYIPSVVFEMSSNGMRFADHLLLLHLVVFSFFFFFFRDQKKKKEKGGGIGQQRQKITTRWMQRRDMRICDVLLCSVVVGYFLYC